MVLFLLLLLLVLLRLLLLLRKLLEQLVVLLHLVQLVQIYNTKIINLRYVELYLLGVVHGDALHVVDPRLVHLVRLVHAADEYIVLQNVVLFRVLALPRGNTTCILEQQRLEKGCQLNAFPREVELYYISRSELDSG